MTEQEYIAFLIAWETLPSQDNEGYLPDRGSFKSGFLAGIRYAQQSPAHQSYPFLVPKPTHLGILLHKIRLGMADQFLSWAMWVIRKNSQQAVELARVLRDYISRGHNVKGGDSP